MFTKLRAVVGLGAVVAGLALGMPSAEAVGYSFKQVSISNGYEWKIYYGSTLIGRTYYFKTGQLTACDDANDGKYIWIDMEWTKTVDVQDGSPNSTCVNKTFSIPKEILAKNFVAVKRSNYSDIATSPVYYTTS